MQHKVVAYITRGRELLVFEHEGMPEAGVQVPAGTVEPDEPLEAALWREVAEESGLTQSQLTFQHWLGDWAHPTYNLVRHYAWLTIGPDAPNHWVHRVHGDGEDNGLRFVFRWEAIAPALLADRFDEALETLLGDGRLTLDDTQARDDTTTRGR